VRDGEQDSGGSRLQNVLNMKGNADAFRLQNVLCDGNSAADRTNSCWNRLIIIIIIDVTHSVFGTTYVLLFTYFSLFM
jgi:hypothetical protein